MPRPRHATGKPSGKNKSEDVTTPFFHSNEDAVPPRLQKTDGDEAYPIFSLLGDFNCNEDGDVFDKTKTVRPQDQFVDMQFSLAGIVISVYKYLTGTVDTSMKSSILYEPGKYFASLVNNDEASTEKNPPQNDTKYRDLLSYFIILYDYLYRCLKRYALKDVRDESNPSLPIHLAEEDGLFVSSAHLNSSTSSLVSESRNLLRVEERILRELSQRALKKELNESYPAGTDEGDNSNTPLDEVNLTPDKNVSTAKIDESFWMSPGHELVGPEKRGGNVQQEVDLAIEVKEIKFSQHPQFTAEEKAFSRVSGFYDEYRKHIEANTFHYLVTRLIQIFQRIRAVRRGEIKKSETDSAPSWLSAKRRESREFVETKIESMMVPMWDDLKSTSSNLVAESEYLRSIPLKIKHDWKEVLAARENIGFSSADVVLKTATLDSEQLTSDVERLIRELNRFRHDEFNRNRRDESYQSTITSSQFMDDVERTLSNINHLSETMEMVQLNQSPQSGWIPKEEKLRRHRVSSEKYFARLLLNGSVVGDTRAEQLDWPFFSVKLNHMFNCRMTQKPAEACVQIWKSSFGFVPDSLICTCFLNILEDETIILDQNDGNSNKVPSDPAIGIRLQFSSVGSDLQHRIKGMVWLATSCKIRTVKRSSPATRMTKIPHEDITVFYRSKRLIRPPEGNDEVRDKKEAHVKNRICRDRQSMMAFKLPENGTLFSNKRLFEEPLRHVLIKKRQINAPSVPSPIPITELEVQNNDVYNDLIRNDDVESSDETILSEAIKKPASVNKQNVLDIIRGIRSYARKNETFRRKQNFAEVIQDVGLLTLSMLDQGEQEMPFPPMKRSLFPKNARRLPVRNQRCSLLLTVVCGKNVPMKLETDNGINATLRQQETANGDDDKLLPGTGDLFPSVVEDEDEAYLGALVKIKLRGKTYQTKVISGTMNPQWKETIRVPLHDILDDNPSFSPVLLHEEDIIISIFDCTNSDLRHIGGYYDDEETRTTEFHYLGHVTIPLITILREGTIDGFVHCHSPHVIPGYFKDSNSLGIPNSEEESGHHLSIMEPDRRRNMTSNSTMLRLHVTTEPYTVIPPQLRPEFPSNEPESILWRTQQWSQYHLNFNEIDPEDRCPVLWPDVRGNSFILSRYISEQAPPLGFDSLASCAHFVSLIPSRSAFEEIHKNMVLTSQQSINIMAGNHEEHAILLTNFFLHLSKTRPTEFGADIFLAVGLAFSEGKTAFVVRRCQRNQELVFWDATTGLFYPQNDGPCPLQRIDYLASARNLFANVEREKKPFLLDFDLSNPRKWAPLHLDGIMTLQDETLHFTKPDNHYARQLQGEVSESIQNAIRGWRRSATSFRSDAGAKVASKIDKLEQARMSGQPVSELDISLPRNITKTRAVFGFTLHPPFSSLQDVLDRVKITEIHNNRNPRVEYAVAVRAFAYPGRVISLWVFLCSLVPKHDRE